MVDAERWHVELPNAQGAQVGDHGQMVNHFHAAAAQPLIGASLGAFSAHMAAGRLLSSSHQQAVGALGESPLEVAADVLRVVLHHDPDRVVAWIADLHITRGTALVDSLKADADWLAPLPEAIHAIHHRQDVMRWSSHHAMPMSRADTSWRGTSGFFQAYAGGHIHWSKAGAWATTDHMITCHAAYDGSGGRLGFPLSAEVAAGRSPAGSEGTFQRFESNFDYSDAACERIGLRCGATVYRSPHGVFATWGGIGEFFELTGGTGGWLGFPKSDETTVGPSRRGTSGWIQHFEGGSVTYTDIHGSFGLATPIADYHLANRNVLGFPVGPQRAAGESSAGTGGTYQRFEGRTDLPEDVLAIWADLELEATGGATVYHSTLGTFAVRSSIAGLYERIGGTTSWLGFPVEDEHTDDELSGRSWVGRQRFEGGVVFRGTAHRTVAVPGAVMAVLEADPELRSRLGCPRSREAATELEGVTLQFFDSGVVTVDSGVPSAWVRPPDSR